MEEALKVALSPGHADGLDCSAALYQYAAGEGSRRSDGIFRAHLATCAACRADLDHFVRTTAQPNPSRRFGFSFWLRGLAVATACAGVLLFLKPRPLKPPRDSDSAILKAKGDTTLHVSVVRNGKTMSWASVDNLLPGDELRYSYSTPSRVYPLLFAADEAGAVVQVFPLGSPTLVQPGDGTMGTAEVDWQPGCQWLVAWFVPSHQVPNPDVLLAAVHKAVTQRSSGSCETGAIEVYGIQAQVKAKRVLAQ
jgi:hypothetical protein